MFKAVFVIHRGLLVLELTRHNWQSTLVLTVLSVRRLMYSYFYYDVDMQVVVHLVIIQRLIGMKLTVTTRLKLTMVVLPLWSVRSITNATSTAPIRVSVTTPPDSASVSRASMGLIAESLMESPKPLNLSQTRMVCTLMHPRVLPVELP